MGLGQPCTAELGRGLKRRAPCSPCADADRALLEGGFWKHDQEIGQSLTYRGIGFEGISEFRRDAFGPPDQGTGSVVSLRIVVQSAGVGGCVG